MVNLELRGHQWKLAHGYTQPHRHTCTARVHRHAHRDAQVHIQAQKPADTQTSLSPSLWAGPCPARWTWGHLCGPHEALGSAPTLLQPHLFHTYRPPCSLQPQGLCTGQLSASPASRSTPSDPRRPLCQDLVSPDRSSRAVVSVWPSDSGLSPNLCAGSMREQPCLAGSPLHPGTTWGPHWALGEQR